MGKQAILREGKTNFQGKLMPNARFSLETNILTQTMFLADRTQ